MPLQSVSTPPACAAVPRILFVDDEPFILSALQRQLSVLAGEWDLAFAANGDAALAAMQVRPADVVVTDMIMPKMDGAALIGRLHRDYPRTVPIVLSGHWPKHPDSDVRLAAHIRVLAKPVSTAVLVDTIKMALCQARDDLACS